MPVAKLIMLYPRPADITAFERIYTSEHVPMTIEKLTGKTKIVMSKAVEGTQATALFYRIAEIHFPSLDALQSCAASEGGQATLAHAAAISTGGAPILLVAEEETLTFAGEDKAAA